MFMKNMFIQETGIALRFLTKACLHRVNKSVKQIQSEESLLHILHDINLSFHNNLLLQYSCFGRSEIQFIVSIFGDI